MKKLYAPAWVTAWATGLLPDGVFQIGKKTPWYRRSWKANMPWIAVALIAPFGLFLLGTGIKMLWPRMQGARNETGNR